MIYFIQCDLSRAIKIGWANRVAHRFSNIQVANPNPLRLLGVIPGYDQEESRWHYKFRHLLIRGEWFRAEPELIVAIRDALSRYHEAIESDYFGSLCRIIRDLPDWSDLKSGHGDQAVESVKVKMCGLYRQVNDAAGPAFARDIAAKAIRWASENLEYPQQVKCEHMLFRHWINQN